ncbi:MAG: DinB family protein [Saprospiraceae bacterium]|nr:DinB family protein [Saprospiraceae bacterium]
MLNNFLENIRSHLLDTHKTVDTWFDKEPQLRTYRPANGGWTIDQILEHIELTSHFLLKLIDKGGAKALRRAAASDWAANWQAYRVDAEKLASIGQYRSFDWIRPEHMEPRGDRNLAEIRISMKQQQERCLHWLERLKNGEGLLAKTTMSVQNLGKLDVYEYIYFLSLHAQRHITQMERNEQAFLANGVAKN